MNIFLNPILKNGYPEHAINSVFKRKLQQLNFNPVHTMEKCPVYANSAIYCNSNILQYEMLILQY